MKILGRAYNKNLEELIDFKEQNSKSWHITWKSWWREKLRRADKFEGKPQRVVE